MSDDPAAILWRWSDSGADDGRAKHGCMAYLPFGRGAATLAIAAVAVSAGLSGCGQPASTQPAATGTSTSVVAVAPAPPTPVSRTAKWVDLQPGDCLAASPPTDPAVVMVTVVDCAGPHRAETFLRVRIPVDAALSDNANRQCSEGLAQYSGGVAGAAYSITYLIDSEQDRTSNNPYPSTVICLLQGVQGQPLTGSAKR